MTLLLFFAATLFTLFAVWRMISPFVGGADVGLRLEHLDEEIREIELLVARREVLVGALRELEFDRETDKIAPDDYARFRARYEREAVSILKRLDEIHGGKTWQARVDEELTDRLGRAPLLGSSAEVAAPDAEPEPDETASEPANQEAGGDGAEDAAPQLAETIDAPDEPADGPDEQPLLRACVSCEEPLDDGDKFCAQCGTPVSPPDDAAVKPPTEATP